MQERNRVPLNTVGEAAAVSSYSARGDKFFEIAIAMKTINDYTRKADPLEREVFETIRAIPTKRNAIPNR